MASFTTYLRNCFSTSTPPQQSGSPHKMEEFDGFEGSQGSLARLRENAPECKVLFVGGILNKQSDVQLNIDALNAKAPVKTEMFWNTVYATHRKDREPKQEVVEALASKIEEHLKENGRLCIIAHSHGAKVTFLALQRLRERNVIHCNQENLEVYTYGGVTTIPKQFAEKVGNFTNIDDLPQVMGAKVWDQNKLKWTTLNGAGTGHQFIEGYCDHAAEKVIEFVRNSRN